MFHDVVRWMLQRDLLVTLHLRVRIVVPATLKAKARRRREELRESGWHTEEEEDAFRTRGHKARTDSGVSERDFGLFDALPAWYMRHSAGSQPSVNEAIDPPILDEGIELDEEMEKEEEGEEEGEEEEAVAEAETASRRDDDEMDDEDDDNETSILADPGRATSLQRRWLQAMSEGKDELVVRRFDQYVDRHSFMDDLELMGMIAESTNTLMASVRTMRCCFGPKYLGGNCGRSYTCMMNT
jgi:nitrogen permease regulator 3-like protein